MKYQKEELNRDQRKTGHGRSQEDQIHIRTHFAESKLAVVSAVSRVSNQHLTVMLNPTLATQNIVNARSHLIPFIVIPKPFEGRIKRIKECQKWGYGGGGGWNRWEKDHQEGWNKQALWLTWEAGHSLYQLELSPGICPRTYFSTSCLNKTKFKEKEMKCEVTILL